LIDLDIRITDSLLDGLIERGFLKHYERNTPRAVRKAIMDMLLGRGARTFASPSHKQNHRPHMYSIERC
jgi:hypothetical protein